jgi:hypothetical protein
VTILVTVGDVVFSNETDWADQVRHKLTDLEGWYSTAYRTKFTERENGDGDHVPGPSYRGSKTMLLKAVVHAGQAVDAAEEAWETIAAVGGDGYDIPLRWEDTVTGVVRTMTVRIDGTIEPIPFAPGKANVAIPLRAYDPRKYADVERLSNPAQANGVQPYGAGLQYPLFSGGLVSVDPGTPTPTLRVSDSFTGADSAPWSAQWTPLAGSGSTYIIGNQGVMTAYNTGYTPVRSQVAGTPIKNAEAYVEFTPPTLQEHYLDVTLRQSSRVGYFPDGYGVQLALAYGSWTLGRFDADNGLTNNFDVPMAWALGTTYAIRLRAQGNVVSAKIWRKQDAEPADWQKTITDDVLDRAGGFALGYSSGNDTNPGVAWDNVQVYDLDAQSGGNIPTKQPALSYGPLVPFNAATAENRGKAAVYPVFRITGGSMSGGFTITDQTTSARVRFVGTVSADETLILDMSTKRILSGANDRTDLLMVNDTMAIPPGERRTYVFETLGGSDTGTPTLTVGVTDAWW